MYVLNPLIIPQIYGPGYSWELYRQQMWTLGRHIIIFHQQNADARINTHKDAGLAPDDLVLYRSIETRLAALRSDRVYRNGTIYDGVIDAETDDRIRDDATVISDLRGGANSTFTFAAAR